MSELSTVTSSVVYQLRLVLRGVSPLIWRRVLVRSDSSIADLHATFQVALGWTDTHLNRFVIHGRAYGVAHLGGISFRDNPRPVRLAALGLRVRERFLYEHDVGDGWQHDVRVERMMPLESDRTYPVCIGGHRAVPPEDWGGPWAFLERRQRHLVVRIIDFRIVERLAVLLEDGGLDAHQEEALQLVRWLLLDRFDCRAVNRRLVQPAAAARSVA